MASSVTIARMAEKMKLTNVLPQIDMTGKRIVTSEINRPAIQLTGFFDHFYSERVQIIGYVEYTYLQSLTREQKASVYVSFTRHRRSRMRTCSVWPCSMRCRFL